MSQDLRVPDTEPSRGGDPLAAMYVVAAIAMATAAVVVVLLMFVPRDWFQGTDEEAVWVPGSLPGWTPPARAAELLEPPGISQIGPGRYVVVLVASNWAFRPDVIRIPAGSEVTFRTRSDEDYHGFALIGTPLILSLAQSEVKEVTHIFSTPGEYRFVCSEYCGGGHITMSGTVFVE
jgi:cytochrome c oxidase subunit 2